MSDSLGSLGSVTAVFDAQTETFDKKVAKSADVSAAASRAIANAATRQKDAQAFAAKFAGDAVSAQSLRIVAAYKAQAAAEADLRKAKALDKVEFQGQAASADLVAAAYQRLAAAKLEVVAATKVEAEAIAQTQITHAEITQQMAAAGTLRLIEGQNSIRSVERFLSIIPGVGFAMQKLFPLVGGIAFAGILEKSGEDLVALYHKGKEAGDELSRAFGEMNEKFATSNDELELANSKLEDELAKLSGHPSDGLKTALLEAAVAADHLQDSLAGDLRTLQSLLKDHDVGAIEGLLTGVASTGDSSKEIKDYAKTVEMRGQEARAIYSKSMQTAGSDHDKQIAAEKAYYAKMDGISADAARHMRQRATEIAAQQKQIDDARVSILKTPTTPYVKGMAAGNVIASQGAQLDLTNVRTSFEDVAVMYDELQRRAQDAGSNFLDAAALGSAKGGNEGDKAAENKLKGIEATFAKLNDARQAVTGHPLTAGEAAAFWVQYLTTFKAKSTEAQKVASEFAKAQADMHEKLAAAVSNMRELPSQNLSSKEADEGIAAINSLLREQAEDVFRVGSRWQAYNNEIAKTQGIIRSTADALKELQLAHGVATGSVSKHDAAMQLGDIHSSAYAAKIAELSAELKQLQDDEKSLNPNDKDYETKRPELEARQQQVQGQILQMGGEAHDSALQDQWKAFSETGLGGAVTALQEFIAASRDTAAQMKQITDTVLNDVNGAIMKDLTSNNHWQRQRVWSDAGKGIATDVAGTALKKGEGSMMDMLPKKMLGKLGLDGKMGSRSNPMWVKSADDAMSAAKGLFGKSGGPAGPSMGGLDLPKLGMSMFGPNGQVIGPPTGGMGALNLPALGTSLFGPNGPAMPNVSAAPPSMGGLDLPALGTSMFGPNGPAMPNVIGPPGSGPGQSMFGSNGSGGPITGPAGSITSTALAASGWDKALASVVMQMPKFAGLLTPSSGGSVPDAGAPDGDIGQGMGIGSNWHYATGGDAPAGRTAWVGENGPELVHFGSAAHVTPNNKLPNMGNHFHFNHTIDARGSTNPAETEAAVRRGILAAVPHIVTASVKATHDYNSRRPSSARR